MSGNRPPEATREVVEQLAQSVIDLVRISLPQLQNEGAFCCLELSYDAVVDMGTLLVFDRDEARREFMNETDDRWFGSFIIYRMEARNHTQVYVDDGGEWPAEATVYIENCREREAWNAVRRFFAEVGRALNDFDWRALFDVTDDFIVFAHDREDMGDIEPYILECVPEAKIALWQVNGWFSETGI